jgi:hypothetical protein
MITTHHLEDHSKPVNVLAANTSGRSVAPERLALSTAEACAALGISAVSLWRLRKRNLIRPIMVLRHAIYPISELQRFLKAGTN